jgi:hypothetical protein
VSFGRFSAIVCCGVAGSLGVVCVALSDGGARAAVALGALLATLNVLAAYALVRWSQGRSHIHFLRALLGGMTLRMALVLGALAAAVRGFGVAPQPLVLSVLAYSLVLLGLETAVLHRDLGQGRSGARA